MRILVVEDDKKVAKFIKRGLEAEQYEVHTAYDGDEGLSLAREKSFELIVLDWMLPKRDGLSVVQTLRGIKNQTPVLMLTARNSGESIVAGLDSGSDGYLAKPFVFSELLARVRAMMRRNELARGAEIKFADLRLNPVRHKVWRKEKEIALTPREYRLLEYFIRNPRQVLTRTMIAQACWDNDFGSYTNIIDVYVNYLRKKIDCKSDRKLIHTERGMGYFLSETE